MNLVKLYSKLPEVYNFFEEKFGLTLPPYHYFFEITYRCNLKCRYCQFMDLNEKYDTRSLLDSELSLKEIFSIIDKIPRFSLITITGGEPFLRKDFYEIVEYACRKHKVHIISNFTIAKEGLFNKLLGLRVNNILSNGLFWISFSLEGNKKSHDELTNVKGSYEKTRDCMNLLKKLRKGRYPKINTQTVITRKNVAELYQVVKFASENGINVCNFLIENMGNHHDRFHEKKGMLNYMTPPNIPNIDSEELIKGLELADELAELSGIQIRYSMDSKQNVIEYYTGKLDSEKLKCNALSTSVFISAKGDLNSCFNNYLGSLKKENFSVLLKNKQFFNFKRKLKKQGAFPGCIGCCMPKPK